MLVTRTPRSRIDESQGLFDTVAGRGGESGPGARPMAAGWVKEIRDQCRRANVAFFFKQWGGVNKKKAGRELEGQTWDELPVNRR